MAFLECYLGSLRFLFMDSNLPIRYDAADLRVFIAPDFYVSFGVDIEAILDKTAYNLWEVGKPPEFALEVASPSTYEKDLYEKPSIYAHIGIWRILDVRPDGRGTIWSGVDRVPACERHI